ncbi:MAG: hypothetical protein L0Z49_09225, partial [Actinobacteria bacterium]|nr:hypothetical protein [Actinomycetota bacterium]
MSRSNGTESARVFSDRAKATANKPVGAGASTELETVSTPQGIFYVWGNSRQHAALVLGRYLGWEFPKVS